MIERKNYLDWLKRTKDTEFVKVITGVRRSGKSVILDQYRRFLISENVRGKCNFL